MTQNITLTKSSTIADFEALVDLTAAKIQSMGLGAAKPRADVRADLLARFADREQLSPADAEALLVANGLPLPPAAPEPTEPTFTSDPAVITQAASDLRARNTQASGPYFWERPDDVSFLDMFIALRRQANLTANLLITGPSGTGKTEGVMRIAARNNIPFYKVDCASVTTADKWLGHKEFANGATTYQLSEHLRWIGAVDCDPGIVLYDEITRLHPTLHNTLLPILDGSQSVWVPELGIHVRVHPDTIIIATANVGANYTGTHKFDSAMSGRFGFRLERDYPPTDAEIDILVNRVGIARTDAEVLVDIANMTRARHRTGDLDDAVSTRNLLDTAALVAAGLPIPAASEYTFVKFFSDDGGAGSQRTAVRQIVTGKAGR